MGLGPAAAAAEVVTDGSLGPRLTLSGPEVEVGAGLGRIRGKNLFHSFERFNVETQGRVTFTGPDGLKNVVSRVTGGERSRIDGTLASTVPGADLYLLNPAGVVFGPNARLDVPAAFHVGTADELRFDDGGSFSARDPGTSGLTVAEPAAFGFLGADAGAITVDGGRLEVKAGATLALEARELALSGARVGVELPSPDTIAAGATVSLTAPGAIRLTDGAIVDASGDGGGRVEIRGGEISLAGRSVIAADNNGSAAAGEGVLVVGDSLSLKEASRVAAEARGAGVGGQVEVKARVVEVSDGAMITAGTFAAGSAGGVSIEADKITIEGRSGPFVTGITSTARLQSSGNAGIVGVQARDIEIRRGGEISSTARSDGRAGSAGNAGEVHVSADRVLISQDGARDGGGALRFTGIGSDVHRDARGTGAKGGRVTVDAREIRIRGNAGRISSNTFAGDAGTVTVRASEALELRDGGQIASDAFQGATGDAGSVSVRAGDITINRGAEITSSTLSSGNAGNVRVVAERISITRDGAVDGRGNPRFTGIRSEARFEARGTDAKAGNVRVEAREALLLQGGKIATSTYAGDAGEVVVTVGDLLELRNGGEIASSALPVGSDSGAHGHAGRVTVVTDRLLVAQDLPTQPPGRRPTPQEEGASFTGIRTETFHNTIGRSGTVAITAREILMRGGEFSSSTRGEGDAGAISVVAERLDMRDGAVIASDARWTGDGGNVSVEAGLISVRSGAEISSNSFVRPIRDPHTPVGSYATGHAGTVQVVARQALVIDSDGVRIDIHGNEDFTGISSRSGSPSDGNQSLLITSHGNAGNVEVRTPRLAMYDAGGISSASLGLGNAGNVTIVADEIKAVERSAITTESRFAGGGQITLRVGTMLHVGRDSRIATSVKGDETTTAGDISMAPRFLILGDGSRIVAQAEAGRGGNILIDAGQLIASIDSLIDATADTGISGTVVTTTAEVDLTSGLTVLPTAFLGADQLLRESCAGRAGERQSSFTGVGRGGLPPSPERPLGIAYLVPGEALSAGAHGAGCRE